VQKKWYALVIAVVFLAAFFILLPYEASFINSSNEVNDMNEINETIETNEIAEMAEEEPEVEDNDETATTELLDLEDLTDETDLIAELEDDVVVPPTERTTLKLTWQEETTVAPDKARLILAVETEAEDVETAYDDNNTIMADVKEALDEYPEVQRETLSFNIYPDRQEELFRVINRLQLDIDNLDNLPEIIDVAIGAGVNRLDSIDFLLADAEDIQAETTSKAISNLQEKAADIVAEFEREDFHFVDIDLEESLQNSRSYLYRDVMATEARTSPGIEPGDIKITTTLRAKISF